MRAFVRSVVLCISLKCGSHVDCQMSPFGTVKVCSCSRGVFRIIIGFASWRLTKATVIAVSYSSNFRLNNSQHYLFYNAKAISCISVLERAVRSSILLIGTGE